MYFPFRSWLRATAAAHSAKRGRLRRRKANTAATQNYVRPNLEPLEFRLAPAIVTPFAVRYSINTTGDIAITGNTLETASTVNNAGRTLADVTAAQNGVAGPNGNHVDNNDWNMAYVDVDNDPTTFNSSQASLNLPAGASVLFAGLYWGSVTTTAAQAAARNTVKFSTPASASYVSLTGTTLGGSTIGSADFTGTPQGSIYQSFANVTSLVQAAGSGTYTLANVQAALTDAQGHLPYMGSYAGWSLVVAFRAPSYAARNLTVFDGYAVQQSNDPALNIPISGFTAPTSGTVNAEVGVVAYEGDLGITGDTMALNGKQLSDAVTPANNFFNASISSLGVLQTAKNPNYVNQMGFDAKIIQAPAGTIPNSATSATITLTTSGDGYFPGVVTTAIDLYAPNLNPTKTVTDLNGGNSLPGDTLQYTVNVTNTGQDAAGKVVLTDPIPANTTYVPGTLQIVSGANSGSKTDASGDDQAFFNADSNQVTFNLGTGATATTGGTLAIGASTSISFDVKINTNVAANTVVTNQATINYTGVTTGFSFASLSTAAGFTVINSIADLGLTKTVSNPTPNVGDSITYTITATNNGPGPGSGITVNDLLPSGLQLTNAMTSQGAYSGTTGLWTIGSLANGASATLTIFATVIGSTAQTNTATLSHTDSIDPNPANNQASATETPLLADLSVSKTVDIARPNVGDTVSFLITVAGAGPNPATNVQLTDLLPAGLMYVSSTPSTGSYNNTSGVWTVGTIANGGSATLQINAKVVSAAAETNTASVTHSDVFDPNTANNSASATVTPQQADLKLTKSVSNANPNVGDNITFLVTLTNLGPDFATGVSVQDSLPAGLTFVSATPSQGTYNPISGQWTVGVVDPATPRTLALVATVISSAAKSNTASISGAAQFDPVTTNNTASVTETPQQADLAVTKTVSNATPNVGDTISFTVTVKNNGPNSATDVRVSDLLPAGLAFVSSTASQGNYFSTTGTWTLGTVNNGAQATLTIMAKVTIYGAQTNTASVTADQFDPNSVNNTASASETPQQADLAITKTVDELFPNVGTDVTFTITVTNHGPNSATNVAVQDLVGSGLIFVSANPSQGTYNQTSGLWTVGTVGLVSAPTLLIMARDTITSPVTNTASISHSDQFDPNPSNNSDSITVRGAQADLAVIKTVDQSTARVGQTVTFTITVTNLDGNSADDVEVTDNLPAGLQFASDSTTNGNYTPITGIWSLASSLIQGETETLTIQAIMLTTTAQTNTATITNSDRPDPNLANNSDSTTINPATADLQIGKAVSNPTPNVGDNITYTIRLNDNGPDTATNVTVQDTLPNGVTFVSSTASQGSYNSGTGVWSVGTVSVSTPQTLAIVAMVTRVLPGPNTASISHSDQFDPNTANNSATASIIPLTADLALSKTVSNPSPNVGDAISFTVTLANNGPANATNVGVTDLLPAGLTFVSASPTQGIYSPATGVWTVGTLVSGSTVTLTLQAMVVSSAARTNTATISHSDQFDTNSGNNSASATETPQQADLTVSKFVDNATPNVGDTVNFTIAIGNIGPSAATNVLLNDLLPAGLAFVSATTSQGSYNPSTGVWNVGTIPDGVISTLTLSAHVVIAGAQINTAAIGHSDQFDPNTANNQASATVTSLQADLQVTKTVSNARPNLGDTVAFTVTLTDLGPSIATNVQVADLLPAGLTLVSALPSQGTYDGATGLWSVATVTTALARTLILNARVDSPDPQTNTATVTASDQFDPNPGNNTASATETPQQADLGLTKTVSNAHPNVGDTIAYTVTLSNAGPDGATHVQVADLLPAGLGFVSAVPSQGTYSSSTGLWNVGTVGAHAGATLQIQAKVNSASPQLNTATISQADQFDPDKVNNSAAALETPQQADLAVLKSVSNPTPNVGDTLTYTILVTNNGPDTATSVVLSDVLPAAVSYQSSSATAGTYDPATRAWTVGTVANGATETLTILAGVINANPQANTANISHADQFDPNPANNSDTASINPQQADLEIGKTVSNPTPNVGDTITFTLTLTDNGPSTATNVQVTDLLPAGLSYLSSTSSQGAYNSATGLWSVGTVTTATPQTLAIQAQVVSPNAQTNTATITAADQFDSDPANNQDSATETPQQADLVIAKAVSNQRPNVGDTVTFTVAVADRGPNAASNVTVQDLLPAGLSLVSFTPSRGTYDPATGIWSIGIVDPSTAQALILNAQVTSASAATNTATITHSDQFDPDLTNNTASATETPQQADLIVGKTVSNTTPNVGDVITYTVTLSNAGPDPATGVQLTDLLPAGLTLVSATESQGAYDSATGLWTVGQVGTAAPATLTLMAKVTSSAPTTNTATITHSDQFDPNTADNSASATETPQQADLSLTKVVSNATPNVGDTITFTVTLSNAGTDTATGVTVQDVLPAGLTFVSATPSQGTYDNGTGVWNVGAVTTTAPQTLLIQATVAVPDPQTNTASISHSDQFDPITGNNTASATETPQHADLALAKTVSNATPNVGDTITFTVTLTDKGPDAASNVQVTDLLPAGLTFVMATPSQGSYNSTSGAWSVGTVTTATPQTLQILATVASPTAQTNTATITHADQFDPNTGDNSAAATETPQRADLQVRKAVSNPTPNVNDLITYTITLTNNGPDPATNVTVQDTLPAGVAFVSATPVGSYDPVSGVWTVGTVNPGTPQTLTITATVISPNPAANTVTISHADQFDPDTANNSDTASVNPQQADLGVSKTVSNATPNVGDTITFTVTLTNTGPANATNVSVADLLPAGLAFVSSTPSQGSYVATTGLWTVGAVSNGGRATLALLARVNSPNAQTNTATISHADQFDPNTGNNSGSATETPQQADLMLSKSVSDATPNVGDTVTFTVGLANQGPDAATNVTIQDLLPAGLAFVSANPSQGTYNNATGAWVVGTVAPMAPQTLVIQARVVGSTPQTNSAEVSHSDQFDPDTTDNSASATETPQHAELAVSKSVSNARPNVGDTIVFTVLVLNNGPDAATGVTVSDLLPPGLSFVNSFTATGNYDHTTGMWTLGTLQNGGADSLFISAQVVSSAAQTNTASISHSDQFDPVTTNNSASATETPQRADLALTKTVNTAMPNVGDTVTFTITLTDKGPDPATNVEVNDLLPAGLTFVSATPSQGAYDSLSGAWAVGTVTTATPQTLQIQARVVSPSAQTNTATIGQADQFDPVTTNNSASATETPQQADLMLIKSVDDATPNVGDVITFTVTLTNNGPNAATNVQVADLLPAGLLFVNAVPSQGTYNGASGVWAVGTVATAASKSLLIDARVVSPDPRTNTATISQSDQFDANTANNSASATETPQLADLALTKTVDNPTPNVGDTITFTLTLTNNGPNQATHVTVQDVLPAGLSFVSYTASQGTYLAATGVWNVGTVTTALPQTLQIRATVVSSGTRINTADILQSDQFDPDRSNNSASAVESPQHSDLVLAKTVSNAAPNVGDTITFTLTISNNGPDAATNVQVTDLLPAGLAFVSATPSQGAYNSTTGVWTAGTVTVGTPQTLQIQATVVSASAQTNAAVISHADQFDPDLTNNGASATETPQQADLRISKTVNNAAPNVGDTVTFTVTVSNLGPNTATNVQVADLLPAGLGFVSDSPSQGSYDAGAGLWSVGTVTAVPQTLQILATVLGPAAQTNTASISHSDQFDPVTTNNSASATETPQQADLAIAKTVSNAKPNVGDTVTFTITLTDKGPSTATNVQVTDLLPAGLSFVSANASQGTYVSATGIWSVGTVTTTTPQTLQIQASVISPAAQTNTATISGADQFDPVTTNNSASATETPQRSDLALSKTVTSTTPNVGDIITFSVLLGNLGPDPATNVRVTDLLPTGLVFVSATPSQGTYVAGSGLWTVGTVAVGPPPKTLLIRARVLSPNPVTNTATISNSDQYDPVTSNDSASATETPQQADLALSKTVSDATPNVGDTITFTVTLTNNGANTATNAQVTDLLPAGLTFVSATASQGTYVAATGIWSAGTVTTATPQTLLIQALVASSVAETNTASITHSDQFDPNTANNSSSATETPQQSDLALTKTVSNATPNVGDSIAFTVTLTNNGVDPATNVQVTDVLPAGLSFVSATPSASYNSATGVWTVGTVTTAAPQSLVIQAAVVSPSAQTNTATISHADQFDPDTGNNSAAATETPQQADLGVTKTVNDPTPNVGEMITYTITLTNNGPDPATNVTVQDTLPAGVAFVSATPVGSYDPITGLWTVGSVNVGTPQTLAINATVTTATPPPVNTASISHADQFDPDTANNSDTASTNPQQADLSVGKIVSDATPNVGDVITFTVTLTNTGPASATNVSVNDLLPAGLTFISAAPSQGAYVAATGIWTVGSLANGAQATLPLQARVTSPFARTNTATIRHADQFDPDTGNNSDSATETPQHADLALTKSVDNARPNVNDTVTFTVGLHNAGPDSATNVVVNDPLPAGLSLQTSTPSQGTYAGGVWTVGTVTPGLAQTLTITALVVSPNAQTNTATIGHSDQFDPVTANNSASATETPQRADLAITKTVSPTTPNVGDTVTYVVTLTNKGPDTATDISVTDLLPVGVTFVSATPSLGSYDSVSGLWTIASLANAGQATLTLNAVVAVPNPQTNTATITGADQFDPVTTNNSAGATITPQQADLALAKSVSNQQPNVGDIVTFTIQVSNHGPNTATNVFVSDLLPAGLTFVSAMPSQGAYNSATGIWTVGTVTTTIMQTLQLQARVASPQAQTNTATILGADQFDPNRENDTANATETPQQADLAVSKTVNNQAPNVGDTIEYTITLTNLGLNSATNVTLQDLLPAGLTFVAATPSVGSYNPTSGVWTVGTVTTTTPQTLLLFARVVSTLPTTNTAAVKHADQYDPNPGNNQASVTETPQHADLFLSKTVDVSTPLVGSTVTFTVTLTDLGPNTATSVVVSDRLPAGLTFVSAVPSQGSYDPNTGVWIVGTVTTALPQNLQLLATVTVPNQVTNTAQIRYADQFDPDLANNTASITLTPLVPKADLSLSKTVDVSTPFVGSTITFTVTLTDLGPNTATSVVVGDRLPAGLTFVSAVPSQGSYNPNTGVWIVGTVTIAAPQTLKLRATVTVANPITNSAAIKHADQFDPVLTNNSASITVRPLVPKADLALSKTANQMLVPVGLNVVYTYVIRNLGPNTATGVTVADPFPAGLVFVSAAVPSQGTYNPVTGVWSVGTMVNGAVATLMVTARVLIMGPIVNSAVAESDEIDPVLANNLSSVTIIGLNPASIVSKRTFLAR
jgi:uncharacterized repeat protein (TIGR01451 family)